MPPDQNSSPHASDTLARIAGRSAVIGIIGLGYVGLPLVNATARAGFRVTGFDIDPAKIGRTRRGLPIVAPQACLDLWRSSPNPILLAAVGARGARALVRQQIIALGLVEGRDWWSAA